MTWHLWFMIGTALGLKLGYDRGIADAADLTEKFTNALYCLRDTIIERANQEDNEGEDE